MNREKTVKEIKGELFRISEVEVFIARQALKRVREISKELSMIQRGRDIYKDAGIALEALRVIDEKLEDYPLETIDMTGVPIG